MADGTARHHKSLLFVRPHVQVADVIFDVSNELTPSSLLAMATNGCIDVDSGQHVVTDHAVCGQPDTNTAVNTQPARPAPVATRVVCVQDADCRLQDCSFSGKEQASKSTNCRLQSAGFQFQISATRRKLRAAADCRVRPEGCRFQSTAFLRKSVTCRRLQSLAGRVQISEYSFFAEI